MTHKEFKMNVRSDDVSVYNVIKATAHDTGHYYTKAANGTVLCEFQVAVTNIPSFVWILWTAGGFAFLFITAALFAIAVTINTRRQLRRRINELEIIYKSGGDVDQLDLQRTLAEQAELLPFIDGLEIQRQRIELCDRDEL